MDITRTVIFRLNLSLIIYFFYLFAVDLSFNHIYHKHNQKSVDISTVYLSNAGSLSVYYCMRDRLRFQKSTYTD